MGTVPIDKGREGSDRPPDDWERINTEFDERARAQRKWEAEHDPSPEFEKTARPLSEEYGSHRPEHLDLSPGQVAEIEQFTGKPIADVLAARANDPRAGHNRDEHGRILEPDGNPRRQADNPGLAERVRYAEASRATDRPTETGTADHGDLDDRAGLDKRPATRTEERSLLEGIADGLRTGRLTPEQAADHLETYRAALASGTSDVHTDDATATDGPAPAPEPETHDQADSDGPKDETNAWERVEGQKPDRASIHLDETRQTYILDGNGRSGGGHLAGTGLPNKSEFPVSWDDDKISREIEDVAKNPDHPPTLQGHDRWRVKGTRDGVELEVIIELDGQVWTGYPLGGDGVIKNDKYGNPRSRDTEEG